MCSPRLGLKFLLLMPVPTVRALGILGALRHVCLCDPAHLGECPSVLAGWSSLSPPWVSLEG